MAIQMKEWGMLAFPGRGVHLPLEGIAEMTRPAERLSRVAESVGALGAHLLKETQTVNELGELADFAGRLRDMEQETREELEGLPVRDWDYAWSQASAPRLRQALAELPPSVRDAARELALRYDAQASLAARRDYELARINRARSQWQAQVDAAVASGDAEAATRWLESGRTVFVPEAEMESRKAETRSRSVLQYWRKALQQDAVGALSALRRADAELPEEEAHRQQLQQLREIAGRSVRDALAQEISREIESELPISSSIYERAVAVGLMSREQQRVASQVASPLPAQKRCEWLRRIDESRPEEYHDLLLDVAAEAALPYERRILLERLRAVSEVSPEARREMSRRLWQMYSEGDFGCPGDEEALSRWGRLQEQAMDVLRRNSAPEACERWLKSQKSAPEAWICTTPDTH